MTLLFWWLVRCDRPVGPFVSVLWNNVRYWEAALQRRIKRREAGMGRVRVNSLDGSRDAGLGEHRRWVKQRYFQIKPIRKFNQRKLRTAENRCLCTLCNDT